MPIPDEVVQLIAGSGNNFHAKVARWFQADGWHVGISPYYMDQSQSKAREIDLVAEKLWPVHDIWGKPMADVAVRLFIECKFIPSYSAFWFTEKNSEAALQLVCSQGPFRPENMYTAKHHYLARSPRVAKLFAASATRGTEADPYYKALNQVLSAMVSLRGGQISVPNNRRAPVATLEFPVVVCSSFEQMYGVDFYSDSAPEKIASNFQLEVEYAYPGRSGAQVREYLLLDFVEYSQLSEFSAGIADDAKAASVLESQH
jgi:hypothetical protein